MGLRGLPPTSVFKMDLFSTSKYTLNIVSWNSIGSRKDKLNWLNEFCLDNNVHGICLQEHFCVSDSAVKLFSAEISSYFNYFQPAMRAQFETRGHASGGLCQFVRKDLKANMSPVSTSSHRLQIHKLCVSDRSILWINSYLPCDDGNKNISELNAVLEELNGLIDSSDCTDILWCGDMNVDFARNTPATTLLKRWLTDHKLVSIWSNYTVDYSHHNLDWKGTSLIDHFLSLIVSSLLPHLLVSITMKDSIPDMTQYVLV